MKRFTLTINGKNTPAKGVVPAKFSVADPLGNLLDGDANGVAGGNAVLMSTVFSGRTNGKTSMKFKEPAGDTGTIVLDDGNGVNANGAFGVLDGHIPVEKKRPFEVQLWIVDPISLQSRITGTVKCRLEGRRRRGDFGIGGDR